MARGRDQLPNAAAPTISLIGPGMRVVGDCVTEGTVRVEGALIGTVYAGKAVVVGKEGRVHGEIRTNDALIAGETSGTLVVASRLEVQATAKVDGEVRARRVHLEEGAVLNGDLQMGEIDFGSPPDAVRESRSTIQTGDGARDREVNIRPFVSG